MPCKEKVKVVRLTGEEIELVPLKVWNLSKGLRVGLFQDPVSGRYFRARVPQDYPEC